MVLQAVPVHEDYYSRSTFVMCRGRPRVFPFQIQKAIYSFSSIEGKYLAVRRAALAKARAAADATTLILFVVQAQNCPGCDFGALQM